MVFENAYIDGVMGAAVLATKSETTTPSVYEISNIIVQSSEIISTLKAAGLLVSFSIGMGNININECLIVNSKITSLLGDTIGIADVIKNESGVFDGPAIYVF